MIPLAKIRGNIYLMISSCYVPVCHCIDDWIQCGVKVACRYHMMNHNQMLNWQNIHGIDTYSQHPLKCFWQNVFGCKEWQANSVSHFMHLWASKGCYTLHHFFHKYKVLGLLKSRHCRCSAMSIFVAFHIDSMIFLQK